MVKSMSSEDSPLASSPSHLAEEVDHLVRSTKKHKSSNTNFCPQRPIESYRDSLTHFPTDQENHMLQNLYTQDEAAGSDIDEDPDDNFPVILLSSEEK